MKRTVIELNGIWTLLLRITLITVPLLCGYQVRVENLIAENRDRIHSNSSLLAVHTQQVKDFAVFMERGDRFTQADGLQLENRLLREMNSVLIQQDQKFSKKIEEISASITDIRILLANRFGEERKQSENKRGQ